MFKEIIDSFRIHNIKVIVAKNRAEASRIILEIIPKKSKVGYCGSVTLEQIGVLDEIRKGDYVFYDRDTKFPKYSPEFYKLSHLAQHADYFLASSNAITRDGQIVNIDRTGNRVSSLIYGPDNVIIVVGKNKIVNNVDKAIERIRTIAAPLNAKRMGLDTPCVKTGKCMDCLSPESICCSTVIIKKQYKKDRMTLIIVDEELGY